MDEESSHWWLWLSFPQEVKRLWEGQILLRSQRAFTSGSVSVPSYTALVPVSIVGRYCLERMVWEAPCVSKWSKKKR